MTVYCLTVYFKKNVMIKKVSRYSLQQIFIESLEGSSSFKIIDGLNPFHILLNGKELYIFIKNLSPAYFTNPDVWRVQLPKKEEFEAIKNGVVDFILLGYDADNDVYTIWHPKWAKQRLNNGESVSFYSRLSLQKEASSTQNIKRLSLNNEGEVIAFPREHLGFLLSNIKTFFQDESDYVAIGSKRRPEANDAYKIFCDLKNIGIFASSMTDNGYSSITISNYCRAIRSLIKDGYITRYRKIFLSCNNLNEYTDAITTFCNQPDISEQNSKWHNTLSAALRAYIGFLIKQQSIEYLPENQTQSISTPQNDVASQYQNTTGKTDQTSNRVADEEDWESQYTDFNGKLTKIANPTLIDKLRPFLDTEYLSPIRAYNEIEDFYGDRYSMMSMDEWMKLFKSINWDNPYDTSSPAEPEKTKSKTEILRVEYPDGKIIQHPKSVDTFISVIENNYPDLIHEMNILHANVNLVTKERSEQYSSSQREIADGWLVFTNITTRRKRDDLLKISEELGLGLKVDLISIATGEIIIPTEELNTSTRQKIKVIFPDGRTIQPNKVLEALVEVVKYAGPERVRNLNITICADNLVLKEPKQRYAKPCKPVSNGWFVNTCSDTQTKYEQIKYISDNLKLNLEITLI